MIQTDTDDIIERIREIGGQLVMLDEDLADFYGVPLAELRAVVSRNKAVFPHRAWRDRRWVEALDATIREQFSAIYEALGMSVTTADPGLSPEQKLH